jgi:hypothetical protein
MLLLDSEALRDLQLLAGKTDKVVIVSIQP